MSVKIVEFPQYGVDVVAELRALADAIDSGDIGAVQSFAWVADCGTGEIAYGLISDSSLQAAEASMLFSMGVRLIQDHVLGSE